MSDQERTQDDRARPPMFTSRTERSSKRAGIAILVLLNAVAAAVIIANVAG